MSYLVLARKYRPQGFDEVVAQGHVTDTLKSAIVKGRLAHAYLFCGPRGTGKTTTARILAKALNCLEYDAPTPTPCGKCESCVSIAASRSADVLEIDGASNRGIGEIQALRERVQYAPQGRYKVFIIDEVHMLTKEAFNALLKTLEEPPDYVVFIFATTEPHKLPPTITSRCQRYDFRRISAAAIAKRITEIALAEGLKLSDEAAFVIAQRADGSLRDSLSLLDQMLAYSSKGELSASEVADILGILPLDAFVRISDRIAERDPSGAIAELDSLLESGIDIAQVASGLTEHLHGALMTALGVEQEGISEKSIEAYKKLSGQIDTPDILRMAKIASKLQESLKSAPMPRFIFEETLVYLTNLDRVVDVREAMVATPARQRISPPRAEARPEERPEEQQEPDETPSSGDPKFDRVIELFKAARGEGKADMLRHAKLVPDEGRVILRFPHSFDYQVNSLLMRRENLDALRDCVGKIFGEGTRLKLIVEEAPAEAERRDTSPQTISDEVQMILDAYDAKLEQRS